MAQYKFYTPTGSTMRFFEGADDALVTWLTDGSHADSDMAAIAASLALSTATRSPVTVRAEPWITPAPDESVTRYPVVYVWTRAFTTQDYEAVTGTVECYTECRIWDIHSDPKTAARRTMEVASAVAAGIKRSGITSEPSGSYDWIDFYSNYHRTADEVLPVRSSDLELSNGYAAITLQCRWQHEEEL